MLKPRITFDINNPLSKDAVLSETNYVTKYSSVSNWSIIFGFVAIFFGMSLFIYSIQTSTHSAGLDVLKLVSILSGSFLVLCSCYFNVDAELSLISPINQSDCATLLALSKENAAVKNYCIQVSEQGRRLIQLEHNGLTQYVSGLKHKQACIALYSMTRDVAA